MEYKLAETAVARTLKGVGQIAYEYAGSHSSLAQVVPTETGLVRAYRRSLSACWRFTDGPSPSPAKQAATEGGGSGGTWYTTGVNEHGPAGSGRRRENTAHPGRRAPGADRSASWVRADAIARLDALSVRAIPTGSRGSG